MTPLPMKTWLNNIGRPVPQWPQRTYLLPQRIMPCYRRAPTEHISYSDCIVVWKVHSVTYLIFQNNILAQSCISCQIDSRALSAVVVVNQVNQHVRASGGGGGVTSVWNGGVGGGVTSVGVNPDVEGSYPCCAGLASRKGPKSRSAWRVTCWG